MASWREPGEERPLFEDPASPSGRPGTRAPHVRLSREGVPISAARSLRVPVETYVVGGAPELGDPDGRFPAAHGITSAGAVLVRPDGIIAWLSPGEAGLPELEGALRTVLA